MNAHTFVTVTPVTALRGMDSPIPRASLHQHIQTARDAALALTDCREQSHEASFNELCNSVR